MVSAKTQKIPIDLMHIMLFLAVFFLTMLATTVYADGEDAFKGEIKAISKKGITVIVTDISGSNRRIGEEVAVIITKSTRIWDNKLNTISKRRLAVGMPVSVKPNTQPNGNIEADLIRVAKHSGNY